jgi:hypothetical protein
VKQESISAAEYVGRVTGRKLKTDDPKRPKYRNEKHTVDGITFDSKREAHRYLELRMAEKAGKIRNLRRQYVFPIVIDGVRVCDYIADFQYQEQRGNEWADVTEDAKGFKTEVYRLKRKLMKAVHGIDVHET